MNIMLTMNVMLMLVRSVMTMVLSPDGTSMTIMMRGHRLQNTLLISNADNNGGHYGHDRLHGLHLHDPDRVLIVSSGQGTFVRRVREDEADLVELHGPRGATVEDVEELRLRLHEDARVAVPELREVLLLATGQPVALAAPQRVAAVADRGHGEELHLTSATMATTSEDDDDDGTDDEDDDE